MPFEVNIERIEALSVKNASAVFEKQRIKKFFDRDDERGFEGGWFEGTIDKVEKNLIDQNTGQLYKGLLFHIRYAFKYLL